ncbi:ABC transporter ATP-binding protein [Tianweitania sediminis]|uniref:ABC transporter ATP-binding protein n=1 Tax=Tianweitania sediminis TaxID=1502156 RepID=A0A8J7RNL0_9HYPH|nr:ABC transporter ATP-binding protein [Tianweitania sediminis]MBP0440376.1 ABC transporter ATP-binding protein [Tianweitania sediminis]
MPEAPVFVAENVSKRFGGLIAVDKVSLEAHAGEILGIMGQNGAGKTSLFNTFAGIYVADGGRMTLNDVDVTALPAWRRSIAGIARTFQIPQPIWSLSVCENVQVGLIAHGKSKAESAEIAEETLVGLGLQAKLKSDPGDLTPGQLRLLEFARAASLRPKLLLLDEVFAGLSLPEQQSTADVVRKLRDSGIAIIWIEHNVRLMMELADRIVAMDHGHKIGAGTPLEVARNPDVIRVYLGRQAADGKKS